MSTARRYWLVVIVIATFLLALAISVQILLSSALDAHRSQKNVAWAAAQLEIEYLQFKHAFSGFAGISQSVPASFLETRYSVFQRRIRVLKQETDTTELAADASYDELIAGLDAVTAADSAVRVAMESKDIDDHKAALNQLARLDSPIRSWVQDVMLRSNPDRQKDELIDAEIKAAGVMSVAALAGFALIMLLMRNIKHVEASREREREARLRVDQASRVKDTFLAVVTHELRTPLNAVIGFSELMKARTDKDQEMAAWADEVLLAGRHLLTLVNQTIDMSKISAGKLALSPAEFDLRLLIADSVTSIKRQINHEPNATSRHEVMTTLPAQDLMIYADEAWLRLALFNTILHGRKKLSSDMPIEITVSHRAGRAHITISHRGHEPNAHTPANNDPQAALDPFVQGELGLSRGAHGLGLEMPIAKAIVEAHDGSLHYEASPNSFRVLIELPLNLAA